MLDQQDGDAEAVADGVDAVEQILGLRRVHTCRRLVEQQQFHAGGEGAGDFQLALGAVRQVRRFGFGQAF